MADVARSEMDGLKTQRRHAARTRDIVKLQNQLDELQSQILWQGKWIHRLLLRDSGLSTEQMDSRWEQIDDDEDVVCKVVEEEMTLSNTASDTRAQIDDAKAIEDDEKTQAVVLQKIKDIDDAASVSTHVQSDDDDEIVKISPSERWKQVSSSGGDAEPIKATTAIEDDDVMLQKIKNCVEIPVSTQAQSMVQNCDVVSAIVTCCRSRLAKLNFALGNMLVTQLDAFLTKLSGCRSGYQECVDIEQQVHQQHKLKSQECVDDEQQLHQQHKLDKVQKSPNFNHQHKIVSRVMAPKKKKRKN